MSAKVTVRPDGTISFKLELEPEVYGMLIKYKIAKNTTDTPVNSSINNILKDFLIDRLAKPSTFKSLKPLDKFDLETGK